MLKIDKFWKEKKRRKKFVNDRLADLPTCVINWKFLEFGFILTRPSQCQWRLIWCRVRLWLFFNVADVKCPLSAFSSGMKTYKFLSFTSVSRDRETTNDSTPGPGIVSSTSNIRFRNQSPSASHRRSRERERIDRDPNKDHSLNQSAEMTADHVDAYHDESRMVDDILGFPSLNSDDIEYTDSDYKQMPPHLQSTPSSRHHRTNSLQAIDRLTTKIACTKESIRREQTARDGERCLSDTFVVEN